MNLGQGTFRDPHGHTLTADSVSLLLDGKPWMPVAGEFQYARYPREEWRDELLKMKSGGVNIISTYVFWIHHEEEQGRFDWSGRRSLREFLSLCRETGLKAIARIGPWCHGEARNGGFPDWVRSGVLKDVLWGSTAPAFLDLVDPYYRQIARQMEGLLWKDGGPVIGVQLDNECNNVPYLLALKDLARSAGIDVPFYTMTGWNKVAIPREHLLPLFGSYSEGFWGGSDPVLRKAFFFSNARDDDDMGAQMLNTNSERSANIDLFPYLCCEIGGGMMSSYTVRIKVAPEDIAAMALVKLGCGNNMPGYYVYHGGKNPEGRLSYLNEDKPNSMPVKDYDFQAPLGTCGEVREHYHLLRRQHLFLEDFGPALARMSAFFPDRMPSSHDDVSTLRWSVRSDGRAGFLFFNNRQPRTALPEHPGTQFEIRTDEGPLAAPRSPVTIPSGCFGIWPINMDCDGMLLEYATAQPVCRMKDDEGAIWYFFSQVAGIPAELAFRTAGCEITVDSGERVESAGRLHVRNIKPGPGRTAACRAPDGTAVNFVVLSGDQAQQLWRAPFAGRERLILSEAILVHEGGDLRLESTNPRTLNLAVFPAMETVRMAGSTRTGAAEGVFRRFAAPAMPVPGAVPISVEIKRQAGPDATRLKGTDEATWNEAAVWTLNVPPEAAHLRLLVHIHFIGDAARLYAGERLCDDCFYNGDPMTFGLWRTAAGDLSRLELRLLPYSDGLMEYLPPQVQAVVRQARGRPDSDKVRVTAEQIVQLRVSPGRG